MISITKNAATKIRYVIRDLANNRTITFAFDDTGFNGKAIELIEKYKDIFIENDKNGNICFVPNRQSINDMQLNTNLKEYCNENISKQKH